MRGYVHGLDPASKTDYFGIVVHELPDLRGDGQNLPRLATLRMFKNISYDRMLDFLKEDLFRRFPPALIVTDYSNERTFSDLLERDYKKKVEKIVFSNQNKLMLKQDAYSILKQGYEFPNPKTVTNVNQRRWLEILLEQLHKEQNQTTRSGKATFDHPKGAHNDLATAWELSIHGSLKLMKKAPTFHHVVTKKFNRHEVDYPGSVRSGLQSFGRTAYIPGEGFRDF